MTTIAYRDGILAADTLVTDEEDALGYMVKIRRLGPLLYGGCGSAALCDRLEAWLRAGAAGAPPKLRVGEDIGHVHVFMPNGAVLWFHEGGQTVLSGPYLAFGSGAKYAKGAMAMGATAEQAVRVAIRHDLSSGGRVTVLKRNAG